MTLFFPRFQEFSPLFQLANELDRACAAPSRRTQQRAQRVFAPRFDVKETKEAYELIGELPGIDQSNVNIEWNDESTLTISGSTQSVKKSTNAPAAEVSEAAETKSTTSEDSSSSYQKPTVEDDFVDVANEDKPSEEASTPAAETTKPVEEEKPAVQAEDKPRYWLHERSYGNFNRTFSFSSRVEHDAVHAALKNGVLNVVIPKAKALEPRRVIIN